MFIAASRWGEPAGAGQGRWGRCDSTPTPATAREGASSSGAITRRLDYHPPLDWDALLAFLGARASAGVDEVTGGAWRRTVRLRARFDLDARLDLVSAHLGRDRRLAAALRRHPGPRVPGAFDGFEAVVPGVELR